MKFYTLASPTTAEYKEKGSKFLAFAFSVDSEDAVKEQLLALRKSHYDARHHCYAYVIGTKEQQWRANDDGEPNHSAGDPILGQIRSQELTNCLVVVVRYFGGTKLGVPGLINAYKTAANDALSQATKTEIIPSSTIEIRFEYAMLGMVERWVEEIEMQAIHREYTSTCKLKATMRDEFIPKLEERLIEFPGITLQVLD